MTLVTEMIELYDHLSKGNVEEVIELAHEDYDLVRSTCREIQVTGCSPLFAFQSVLNALSYTSYEQYQANKKNVKGFTLKSAEQEQGKQSAITTCFWRLDPDAMLALGRVLAFGEEKYQYQNVALGRENWRLLAHRDHVDHALEHLVRYLKEIKDGEQPNDEDAGQHLEHAFCRIMFALGSKQ